MAEVQAVLTFHSTTEAMAFERACKELGLPGRLIPMPVAISAQCGLAWLIGPEDRNRLLEQAQKLGLKYERLVELK
ncbi:MAG: DUF3343 domain-containing protein [Firmicutes bacterium]|jgi:glycerol-3-phosphate O-acyltransferase|nr:DUF3343 domain-containing protein [Bacillota bacterium]NLO66709.1 DUF3343 domain-containing protein [Bacillota bacterium]